MDEESSCMMLNSASKEKRKRSNSSILSLEDGEEELSDMNVMDDQDAQFLVEFPGYPETGIKRTADRLGIDLKEITLALRQRKKWILIGLGGVALVLVTVVILAAVLGYRGVLPPPPQAPHTHTIIPRL